MEIEFYATPGPLTELAAEKAEMIGPLGTDPGDLSRVAQGLLVAPSQLLAAKR